MEEIWKDVKGYEGLYMVSNKGRIKSMYKQTKILKNDNILKPALLNSGYLSVMIYKNKTRKRFTVHRLVAEAFIENPDNKNVINHIDEDKTNNCVENLEWCDYCYNNNYGSARFKQSISMSTPIEMFTTKGESIAKFRSIPLAAKMCNVTPEAIRFALHNPQNTIAGFLWRYLEKY